MTQKPDLTYPISLEQWIPVSGKATIWTFTDPGTPLRITCSTAVATPVGTITIHASPDLKPGEVAFQPPEYVPDSAEDRARFPEHYRQVDELRARQSNPPKPVDPLDVEYDGVTLQELLQRDQQNRCGDSPIWGGRIITPAQRAAISAHWSAELRAKVAAAKQKDRNQVTLESDE